MRSQYKTFHLLRERFYYQASSCFGCKIALFFQKVWECLPTALLKLRLSGPDVGAFRTRDDVVPNRVYIYIYTISNQHFKAFTVSTVTMSTGLCATCTRQETRMSFCVLTCESQQIFSKGHKKYCAGGIFTSVFVCL